MKHFLRSLRVEQNLKPRDPDGKRSDGINVSGQVGNILEERKGNSLSRLAMGNLTNPEAESQLSPVRQCFSRSTFIIVLAIDLTLLLPVCSGSVTKMIQRFLNYGSV